ncbi:MAG: nicotinate-nucleotide adenylyltransferase [Clostridia bacterium]|nr:nicotinate-nucleotide adenylyltransferase [Clostridia bacterium]
MRIGIFGGTFNPVHLGHIWTARHVREELSLDKLFMVVAADPPHKPDPARLAANIRFRMLEGALEHENGISASDVEIKREGKSYTVDTVDFFKRQIRGAEIYLIVGADMLESFPNWRDPEGILRTAKILAVGRPGHEPELCSLADGIMSRFGGEVTVSSFRGPDISSTEVRRRMFEAEPVDTLVAMNTEHFLYENALYMPDDIVLIRNSIGEVIRKKRLRHTMLTCCEAVKLAKRYGADMKKARLAALLHDCIKLPNKELLDYCERNGIFITAEEEQNPYLIHSRLGAVLAMEKYGVTDPEVLSAISCHTIGRVGMSLMDKIIYVADKIEPSRDFDGVDDIRDVAYSDINRAMLLVMRHSADYTKRSGRAVNPSTQSVIDYLNGLTDKDPEENNG